MGNIEFKIDSKNDSNNDSKPHSKLHSKTDSKNDSKLHSMFYNLPCSCHNSPFKYSPAVHAILGDFNIIGNEPICKIFAKGPTYRELHSINWNHNWKLFMDTEDEYATNWTKREKEIDTLSDWVSDVVQELPTLPGHVSLHSGFSGVSVARSLVICNFFVDCCLSSFLWSLYCLSFFDLRLLITSLVS